MPRKKRKARAKAKRAPAKKAMASGCSEMHHMYMKKKGLWMILIGVLFVLNMKYAWMSLDYLLAALLILFGLKKMFLVGHKCC